MIKKPKYKIARRLGAGVFDKTQTPKFSAVSGQFTRGGKRPKALSEYASQLLEKQKIRFSYGITERQLSNYVKKATEKAGTQAAVKFYEELESRLDNVLYRMGLAPSRRAARQMVSHGHFTVGGKRVTVPSYRVRPGDAIRVREGSKGKKIFEGLAERLKEYNFPTWLSFDPGKMEGEVKAAPENTQTFIDIESVLEFYSR
ncbi:MAG: 30S ribosomal protein S4 [Patescibacteria group bacterium]